MAPRNARAGGGGVPSGAERKRAACARRAARRVISRRILLRGPGRRRQECGWPGRAVSLGGNTSRRSITSSGATSAAEPSGKVGTLRHGARWLPAYGRAGGEPEGRAPGRSCRLPRQPSQLGDQVGPGFEERLGVSPVGAQPGKTICKGEEVGQSRGLVARFVDIVACARVRRERRRLRRRGRAETPYRLHARKRQCRHHCVPPRFRCRSRVARMRVLVASLASRSCCALAAKPV